MRKLLVLLTCLICGSAVSLNAQTARLQEREAEWKSYVLPQTNFSRQVNGEKTVVFRVPADWKQQGSELVWRGPNDAQLSVTPQTVPDGYPLTEYVASVLKGMADVLGSTESILTRRTQFQDLEAREVFVDLEGEDGKAYRSTTWITISGPMVLNINIVGAVEHAAAFEPFFKATVQSVMFVPGNFAEFETARSNAIKTPAPGPINEIETIVASLNELNSDREAAINRLTPLFLSQPDSAVDLLVDRRATVRSAAAEALARSKNAALKPILWHLLDDHDPFVGEAAAKRLALETDVVAQLLNQSWTSTAVEKLARVWPFMSKESRVKFMQGLFNQTTPNRDVQTGVLTLLRSVPADEFKIPFERILAANNTGLTTMALRVANDRGESLPVQLLNKLLKSPEKEIKRLAAESMGQSAGIAQLLQLENLAKDADSAPVSTDKEREERTEFVNEIKLSLAKIRLRQSLSVAEDQKQWRKSLNDAYADSSLSNFAWRFECEATVNGCLTTTPKPSLPLNFKIKSFGENLFPRKMTHYSALPNPAQAVQRFYATLHGLQLDSPRAQASLVLVMGKLRETLGQNLGAPSDAPTLIEYTGIQPDSPIAMGVWTAAEAHDSITGARRRAIVVRVKDRDRFARVVENYQQLSGNFLFLTDYVAVGTRAAAALPALLPFSAQAILTEGPDKKVNAPALSYSVVGQTEWNGIPIKTIDHLWIDGHWGYQSASTYLTFIGDVAILTQDLASVRELLSNAIVAEQQLLAGNEEFRRTVATEGDVVYFSDLKAVFPDPKDTNLEAGKKANESGALKFSSSAWENTHRLNFEESEWAKPLLTFHPKDLTAPRELLPSSTLAYYLMKLDVAAAWQTWPKTLLHEERFELDESVFALDL
ncbi:MAG TPA: HEAT repeat domain-containing protein, partial [Pyrinomonadaceae bacterium]|nr:HEAT repeat domain-containing protein [Pyrinomonadaceae bacterium]